MMDDNPTSQIWFKAPAEVRNLEALCPLCRQLVRPGEVIMDDGSEFIHATCYEEEITTND